MEIQINHWAKFTISVLLFLKDYGKCFIGKFLKFRELYFLIFISFRTYSIQLSVA